MFNKKLRSKNNYLNQTDTEVKKFVYKKATGSLQVVNRTSCIQDITFLINVPKDRQNKFNIPRTEKEARSQKMQP